MPRVAVLFEYPTLLGGERSFLAVAERLRTQFEFVAIAPASGPLADALRAAAIEVAASPLFDDRGNLRSRTQVISRLVETIGVLRPDLVHGNSLAMGRLTGAAASQLDVPCTAHLRDIVGLSAAAMSDLSRNIRLIAVSEATRAYHVGNGLPADKVVVVHNGIDFGRFQPRTSREAFRKELGIPLDAPVVLTVGQIGLRKGWDLLAGAAERLAEDFPALQIVLAGERYSDKPETVAYEQSVRDQLAAALPGRSRFSGYRSDMPDLLAAADLLVHPARQEPFGRVLLEAAVSGLPIVATDVGGTREILEDGVTARLVPPGDAAALASAIAELLSDPQQRTRFSAAARRFVEMTFPAAKAADRLAAVWTNVLSERRSSGSQPR